MELVESEAAEPTDIEDRLCHVTWTSADFGMCWYLWESQSYEYRETTVLEITLDVHVYQWFLILIGFNFLYLRHGLTRLLKFIKVLNYMNLSINKMNKFHYPAFLHYGLHKSSKMLI